MRKLPSSAVSTVKSRRRLWSRSRLGAAVSAAAPRAVVETVEPRVMLSATVTYQPQKGDGSLGPAVAFQTGGGVQDFSPDQVSLLQKGFAAPAYELFLNVDGIVGDSDADKHQGAIDLLAFNWGADATGSFASGGGGGAGKGTMQELHVVSRVSKASPGLIQSLGTGTHHQEAGLVVRRAGKDQQEFLKIDLDNVVISSYQVTTATDGRLLEEFTLNFADVEMEYRPQKPDGTLDAAVKFAAAGPVEDFAPKQRSILQDGFVAPSGVDYYLQIDGVIGESAGSKHDGQIDVLSFEWGGDGTSSAFGGGGGAGKPTFHEMHFVSNVSKASPKLMDMMVKGVPAAEARFSAVRDGKDQQQFFTIELDGAVVSSYQVKSTPGGQLVEEYTLNFQNFELEYRPQKADGTLDTGITVTQSNVLVEQFAPEQQSQLDAGNVDNGNLEMFLKVDGVLGESADGKHNAEIDVLAYAWGGDAAFSPLGGGAVVGKATMQELHVVSRLSKASPQILGKVNSGVHIPQADLVVRRGGKDQQEFLRIDLDDVLISGYQVSTAPDGTLLEEYTVNFNEATLAYSPQKPDGTLDTAVTFHEEDLAVQEFSYPENSLIQTGYALPAGSQEYFLKVSGIPGESEDHKQKDVINILAFSWGADGASGGFSGGGGTTGKTVFHEAHFVSAVSKASPKLMDALAKGMHIPDAVFRGLQGFDGFEFLEVKLTGVIVSSYQVVLGQHGQLVEEFTLNFSDAFVEYTPQDGSGQGTTPVTFQALDVSTQDFKPEQRSLLHSNVEPASNIEGFLVVEGVEGESDASKHQDAIDVVSFSWGGDSAGTFGSVGGAGVGKTTLQEFHIVSRFNTGSVGILDLMDDGTHVPKAELFLCKAGASQTEFYKVKLEDVIVSSYQVTTAQDGTLLEEYTLSYAKAGLEYVPHDANGSTGTPVTFQETGLQVEDFAPEQLSILETAPIAPAGLELFLSVDGIEGESNDSKQKDRIDVLAFSWGGDAARSTFGGGGASVGRTRYQELHVVTRVSKATPPLLDRLMKGHHIPEATLAVGRGFDQEFLKIRLVDVIVSSYQVTTALDGTLVEEFTLSFGPASVFGTPAADAGGPYQVGDGQSVALSGAGSFDPDQDAATLTYEWDLDGDGIFGETGGGAVRGDETGATPTFSAAGLFGPQTRTITLRVTDATGKTDTDTATVTINDITPPDTIIDSGPAVLTNQTSATFVFHGTDQGTPADQVTFSAEIDGGTRVAITSPHTLNGLADGVHTIKIYAKDQAGNEDPTPAEYTWKVDTIGPSVLNASAGPSPAGQPITITATISDLLAGATNIAGAEYSLDGVIWLPMSASDGSFDSPEEDVTATIAPLPVGLYTLRIRGSDAAGNTGGTVTLDLPVFDADTFVTGGGFIKLASGVKAHLNLNVAYDDGASVPDGQVSFRAGSLNFASTDLDYLLVTGAAGRIAGSGQINGAGDYSFEVWMTDGNLGGGAGGDTFRIRIVDNVTGSVVFDNGTPSAVQGGNIMIHS